MDILRLRLNLSISLQVIEPYVLYMFLFICHGELNMDREYIQPGFKDILDFKLVDALFGRRARRFFIGASIPDGYFEYKSKHDPLPLTEKEQMIILSAAASYRPEIVLQ
jgi:hypothetical protein